MGIDATFWHRAKVYFTCLKHLLWLIAVPDMNKINPFLSEIAHQTHKFMTKIAIINWPQLLKFGIEPNTILHASAKHHTWLLCQICIISINSFQIYHNKQTKRMKT